MFLVFSVSNCSTYKTGVLRRVSSENKPFSKYNHEELPRERALVDANSRKKELIVALDRFSNDSTLNKDISNISNISFIDSVFIVLNLWKTNAIERRENNDENDNDNNKNEKREGARARLEKEETFLFERPDAISSSLSPPLPPPPPPTLTTITTTTSSSSPSFFFIFCF